MNSAPMMKFFSELLLLILTGAVASATIILRKQIKHSIDVAIKYIRGHHYYNVEEVHRDIRIHTILTELRIHSGCDRSYILQFQNGSVFSTRNQVWRISCTHESPNQGIRPCVGELQHIISSSVSEILYPLWYDDLSNCPGVTKVSPAVCHCSNTTSCRLPKGVRLYDVDKMPESFSKGLLQSKATKYMLVTPILDPNNNQVAILMLDYCWDEANPQQIITFSEKLCQTASKISFELRNKKQD